MTSRGKNKEPDPIIKRKMPMICIETLPNGYSLKFDGMKNDGYMYFTPEKLLEGFMLHIGLNMTEELDTETMQDFILSATNWSDNRKCIDEIKTLNDKIRHLQSQCRSNAYKAIYERSRLLTLRDDIQKTSAKLKDNKDVAIRLNGIIKGLGALKPWTLKHFGIGSKDIIQPEKEDEEDEE